MKKIVAAEDEKRLQESRKAAEVCSCRDKERLSIDLPEKLA